MSTMGDYSFSIPMISLGMVVMMFIIILSIEHDFSGKLFKEEVECKTRMSNKNSQILTLDGTYIPLSEWINNDVEKDTILYIMSITLMALSIIGIIILLTLLSFSPDTVNEYGGIYKFIFILTPLLAFIGSGLSLVYIVLRNQAREFINNNPVTPAEKLGVGIGCLVGCSLILGIGFGVGVHKGIIPKGSDAWGSPWTWIFLGTSIWLLCIGLAYIINKIPDCENCFQKKCSDYENILGLTEGETALVLDPKPEETGCIDGYPYVWKEPEINVTNNVATITQGKWDCGPYQTPPGCSGQSWDMKTNKWMCPVTAPTPAP